MMAERPEIEARAERCLRRGELGEALRLYRALIEQFPEDEVLQRKFAQLQDSVDPKELMSAKLPASERLEAPASTPEQEGERLFAIGDYTGAMAAYRRALAQRPGSELIQERLIEIYRLAQQAGHLPSLGKTLPREREPLLRALLERIASRKRATLG